MFRAIIKRTPLLGPVISSASLAYDVKEIVETATPVGAAKIIAGRLINECSPPELLIAGKCVMLVGGIVATVSTGGNPIVLSATLSAFRSIIKE